MAGHVLSHLLTHAFRLVLHTSLDGDFPNLPLGCERLPFRDRYSRVYSKLEHSLPFVDGRDRLDWAVGRYRNQPKHCQEGRWTYAPQVLQKYLDTGVPLRVSGSSYCVRFSSPEICTFSVSMVRFAPKTPPATFRHCEQWQRWPRRCVSKRLPSLTLTLIAPHKHWPSIAASGDVQLRFRKSSRDTPPVNDGVILPTPFLRRFAANEQQPGAPSLGHLLPPLKRIGKPLARLL